MTPAHRLAALDRLRGIAILLMVLDHALVAAHTLGYDPEWVLMTRLTLTRAAMPLFMLISGALWVRQRPRRRRVVAAFIAGLVVETLLAVLWPEFGLPEIMLLWAGAAALAGVIVRWPIPSLILAYTQWAYWPVAWDGYQPGAVVLFLAVGVLWGRGSGLKDSSLVNLMPGFLGAIGRYPLTWYLAHLAFLTALVSIGG